MAGRTILPLPPLRRRCTQVVAAIGGRNLDPCLVVVVAAGYSNGGYRRRIRRRRQRTHHHDLVHRPSLPPNDESALPEWIGTVPWTVTDRLAGASVTVAGSPTRPKPTAHVGPVLAAVDKSWTYKYRIWCLCVLDVVHMSHPNR